MVLGHQRDRVGGENPRAIERAAVQDHPLEADVVARRRREPTTAVEGRGGTLRLIGLLGERRIGTAILTPVDRHETRLLGFGHVVEGVGHPERREDALAEILLQILAGKPLNQPPDPIDARPIDPLCPRFEEQRTRLDTSRHRAA